LVGVDVEPAVEVSSEDQKAPKCQAERELEIQIDGDDDDEGDVHGHGVVRTWMVEEHDEENLEDARDVLAETDVGVYVEQKIVEGDLVGTADVGVAEPADEEHAMPDVFVREVVGQDPMD
jgi:hypothetical protein